MGQRHAVFIERELECGCVVSFRGTHACPEGERLLAATRAALEEAQRTGNWSAYDRIRAQYAAHRGVRF